MAIYFLMNLPRNMPAMGQMFCFGSHRTRNFTHANRAARGDWKQMIQYGEIAKCDEFYAALVRLRQPQYELSANEKR